MRSNGRRPSESNSNDVYPGSIDKLSRAEELPLIIRAQAGDREALDRLVRANVRFVVSVARDRFVDRGLTLQELVAVGVDGLLEAIGRFDASSGYKLISYAVWWIRQRMNQALVEQGTTVRLPNSRRQDYAQVRRAMASLYQEQERAPTSEELVEATGLSAVRVGQVRSNRRREISLDEAAYSEEDDETILNLTMTEDDGPEEQLARAEQRRQLCALVARLEDRERRILVEYFGLDGEAPQTLSAIGLQNGLSRERIRQLKEQGLEHLRRLIAIERLCHRYAGSVAVGSEVSA